MNVFTDVNGMGKIVGTPDRSPIGVLSWVEIR